MDSQNTKQNLSTLPVAVIGAGPVGLAAAAHLVQRGLTPLVFEASADIAANFASFAQVKLFSPWRYNLDKAAVALLKKHHWSEPNLDDIPTAGEMIRHYLEPLAKLPEIAPHIKTASKVVALSRLEANKVKTQGRDQQPFVIRVETPQGQEEFLAQAILDASGTWNQPNPMGSNGLPALGEEALKEHISYGMPDILGKFKPQFAHKRVLVVGSGHSAAGNLIALSQLAESAPDTQIFWAIRGENFTRIFGGGSADGLPARGALGQRLKALKESGQLTLYTQFNTQQLTSTANGIDVISHNGQRIEAIDEMIVSTGSRPNLTMNRELRIQLDAWLESTEALAPLIDPNDHSCGTVRPHGYQELAHPETNYYMVGAKSYGRAPNFLMATGYEQVRSIVDALVGDMQSANDVQLDLPQTGVCNSTFEGSDASELQQNGCCGIKPTKPAHHLVVRQNRLVVVKPIYSVHR